MKQELFFRTAIVDNVSSDGVTLFFMGETTATTKKYQILASAALQKGDKVFCAKISGTYVVLGVLKQVMGGS